MHSGMGWLGRPWGGRWQRTNSPQLPVHMDIERIVISKMPLIPKSFLTLTQNNGAGSSVARGENSLLIAFSLTQEKSSIISCIGIKPPPMSGNMHSAEGQLKKKKKALAGVAQWIECWPVNQRVTGLSPSQGTHPGGRPGPQ